MTNIEQKALALVKAVSAERCRPYYTRTINRRVDTDEALCRAIEQHEAFRQEVSDTIQAMLAKDGAIIRNYLDRFIIPAPKPDPLVEAMADCGVDRFESWADQLRAALDARGFEIREKGQ